MIDFTGFEKAHPCPECHQCLTNEEMCSRCKALNDCRSGAAQMAKWLEENRVELLNLRAALAQVTAERDKLSASLQSTHALVLNNYGALFPNCAYHGLESSVDKMASEIQVLRFELASVVAERDAAIARAEKAEAERDELDKSESRLITERDEATDAFDTVVTEVIGVETEYSNNRNFEDIIADCRTVWEGLEAERDQLAAQNRELRKSLEEALDSILKSISYVVKTLECWDKDQDSKVGKRLSWLAGYNPGYEPGEKSLGSIATAIEDALALPLPAAVNLIDQHEARGAARWLRGYLSGLSNGNPGAPGSVVAILQQELDRLEKEAGNDAP